MDRSKVPRRAPVCSNLSLGLQQALVELWKNWRDKIQSSPDLQPLWKEKKEDLSIIELFSSSTALRPRDKVTAQGASPPFHPSHIQESWWQAKHGGTLARQWCSLSEFLAGPWDL